MLPQTTLRWLNDAAAAASYSNNDLVVNHIKDTLSVHNNILRIKTDVYTSDDGRAQLLLCLHGLLPVAFRGATYNIPLAIWFPFNYPVMPPIVYVTPTQDMLVRKSAYVDLDGRTNIPYTRDWQKKHEAHNLLGLIDALVAHFSKSPPVYAKPQNDNASSPSHPPLPPPIPIHLRSSSLASPSPPPYASGWSPRPPPPIPPSIHSPPLPPSVSIHQQQPPPPPPRPQSLSPSSQFTSNQISPITLPPSQPPIYSTSYQHQFQQQQQRFAPPVQQLQYTSPPPTATLSSPPAQIQPEIRIPPPDLLSDDDPLTSNAPTSLTPASAPPKPPNPLTLALHTSLHTSLTTSLSAFSQTAQTTLSRQRLAQTDLLRGNDAIRDEMARLRAVKDVCVHVRERMRGVVGDVERNLAEVRRKGDVSVDECVIAGSIVHDQLMNLVADDAAIEDTLYHLHRALGAGRIDLERFLRTTRVLAEEQFMKRALAEKILRGIPMGSVMM